MADTLTREAIAFGSQPLSPVPQYWNGASYEKAQGINGAVRSILFDSAGQTFISSSPAIIGLVSSAQLTGDPLLFTPANPGHVEIVSSAGNTFTTTSPGLVAVLSASSGGTAVFGNSSPAFTSIISSAGGTAYFSRTNPGADRQLYAVGASTLYTATVTWTSGTTATSVTTLSVGVITATFTTNYSNIAITNDGPYALLFDVLKVISANSTTFITSSSATIGVPANIVSASVTIGGTTTTIFGLFNYNQGITLRLTSTANFTATVTNNIIIKEMA